MTDAQKCRYCNGTGMVAMRSRDGAYAFPGPVPDDAKGYTDADCWHCDSGPPQPENHAEQRGRNDSLAGKPFNPSESASWQRGWKTMEAGRCLDEGDGQPTEQEEWKDFDPDA